MAQVALLLFALAFNCNAEESKKPNGPTCVVKEGGWGVKLTKEIGAPLTAEYIQKIFGGDAESVEGVPIAPPSEFLDLPALRKSGDCIHFYFMHKFSPLRAGVFKKNKKPFAIAISGVIGGHKTSGPTISAFFYDMDGDGKFESLYLGHPIPLPAPPKWTE